MPLWHGLIFTKPKPKQLFYGRQETMDHHWNLRMKRKKEEATKANKIHDEEKPVYTPYPKLNIKFSDFVPIGEDFSNRELTVDWDLMRERIGDRR